MEGDLRVQEPPHRSDLQRHVPRSSLLPLAGVHYRRPLLPARHAAFDQGQGLPVAPVGEARRRTPVRRVPRPDFGRHHPRQGPPGQHLRDRRAVHSVAFALRHRSVGAARLLPLLAGQGLRRGLGFSVFECATDSSLFRFCAHRPTTCAATRSTRLKTLSTSSWSECPRWTARTCQVYALASLVSRKSRCRYVLALSSLVRHGPARSSTTFSL